MPTGGDVDAGLIRMREKWMEFPPTFGRIFGIIPTKSSQSNSSGRVMQR
jgi:hypothetical protein